MRALNEWLERRKKAKARKQKVRRRLVAWRDAREREYWRNVIPVPKREEGVRLWASESNSDAITAEGVYHHWRGWGWDDYDFKVVKIDGRWYSVPSGKPIRLERLLSILEAEEIKRKYPSLFNEGSD